MNNKKGFTMVEAAIIYPIVIAAIMCLIYIMICMYIECAVNAHLNIELRENVYLETETGEKNYEGIEFKPFDKYGNKVFSKKVNITKTKIQGKQVLHGHISQVYKGNSIISKPIQKSHNKTTYLINEKDYIRKADMLSI